MNELSKKSVKIGEDLESKAGSAWSGISDTVKSSARDAADGVRQTASSARDYAADTVQDGVRRAASTGSEAATAFSSHVRKYPVMSAVLFLGGLLAGSLLAPRR